MRDSNRGDWQPELELIGVSGVRGGVSTGCLFLPGSVKEKK